MESRIGGVGPLSGHGHMHPAGQGAGSEESAILFTKLFRSCGAETTGASTNEPHSAKFDPSFPHAAGIRLDI